MEKYKDKLSTALLPKIKGWCISEGNIDGLVRCVMEEIRKNPDPQIIAKAFEVETRMVCELYEMQDHGIKMTPESYAQFIIRHWNDETD